MDLDSWKILVIDDDKYDYQLVEVLLMESNQGRNKLKWASSYQAGIDALDQDKYDAVLVDYRLGAQSGLELIRVGNAFGVNAPFILLTGRGSHAIDVEAMQAGASLYLSKDEVSASLLERAIRYAIERFQTEEALRDANAALERRVKERTRALEQSLDKLRQEMAENLRVNQALVESEARLREALQHEQAMRVQLIQGEKYAALARLVASVAHELNNPIQTILNSVYLAKAELPKDSNSEKVMEMAVSEARRVARLVDQLRETYRPDRSSSMGPFNLVDVLKSVKNILEPHLSQNHSQLQLSCPKDFIKVNGNPDQIKQVCLNISLNAIEAMQPAGGLLEVSISVGEADQPIGIAFCDHGPGFPPELQDRIFEPFMTTKTKGTGLGLSICYEIMQNHGGSITLENHPGDGAIFTVWIPAAK